MKLFVCRQINHSRCLYIAEHNAYMENLIHLSDNYISEKKISYHNFCLCTKIVYLVLMQKWDNLCQAIPGLYLLANMTPRHYLC